ncbi:MAG: hypothetical protein R2819_15540, partial [Allomuricauda sp.]
MKTQISFLIIGLLMINTLTGQIKIGDNPQNIDPASVLELESTSKVLVISRVTDAQMSTITPLPGALVYNTDQGCIHYYDGTQWINICEAFDNTFTVSTNAIFNAFSRDSTVVVTQTDNNYNFEVNKITGDNIVNTSINGSVEIQQETITRELLAPKSVSLGKLADGVNPGDLIKWNGTQWILDNEETIDITEKDSIVGNEILDVRPGGSLERLGLGTEGNPYTVDVLDGGINTPELADNAVTNGKLDKAFIPLSGFGAATANVDMGGFQINNLQDPTVAQDAATKGYVDTSIAASDAADNDTDNTNEYNTGINLNATSIEITDAGGTLSQDLDGTFATDAELAASDAADGDTDSTNELQNLSIGAGG